MAGKIPLAKAVTYDDLAELIVNDYRNNGRKSMWSLEHVRLPKLAEVFSGTKSSARSRGNGSARRGACHQWLLIDCCRSINTTVIDYSPI